ncbi:MULTISPECIES: hypothetical protein [Rhizobium/Agrobacterium group]|uniref:Uncharacterized protein n=1 Tax=Agrobacterium genomosp. 2 str. CFBP 5494 TaxID=1183436 RepID=A0A9W5AZA8_9HYPH|nr:MULTISPECIES: hypothetical protein [Rhizobium/Agrobacterium group]CAD7036418.1 hypothetical protein RP007_04453 [Rhizobium sp. P007]CUW88518.1 hypothetical protein AGR2A_Cc140086 [Agrobacterium genomosp. 2 str. CFBP 5494]
MQTLKSTLATEYRAEVIFGYVHRRQKEIFDILYPDANYEKLNAVELLDLHFVREFAATVAGNWKEHSREKMLTGSAESVALKAAALASGIAINVYRDHGSFGMTLALRVIGRLEPEKEARYKRVIDGDAADDVPQAA